MKIIKNIKRKIFYSFDKSLSLESSIVVPKNLSETQKVFKYALKNKKKITFVGSGYSYGDQNFNHDGIVISTEKFNKFISLNKKKKIITVEPGVKVIDVVEYLNKRKLSINNLPGNLEITVGGAIGNNVHGKDSYKHGYFSDNIKELTILKSDNKIVKLKRNNKNFKYFSNSLGLLGFFFKISLKVQNLKSTFLQVEKLGFSNIYQFETLLAKMSKNDYFYAYVNTFTKKNIGNGFFEFANYCKIKREPKKNSFFIKNIFKTSFFFFKYLSHINFFFKFLNYTYYFLSKKNFNKKYYLTNIEYFQPLRNLPNFHKLFINGFREIQIIIDKKKFTKLFITITKLVQNYYSGSFICSIKLHKKDNSIIRFCGSDSLSFGINLNFSDSHSMKFKNFMTELTNIIKKNNCRIYFAKDSIFNFSDLSNTQQLDLKKFIKFKKKFDKKNLFENGFYSRLNNK